MYCYIITEVLMLATESKNASDIRSMEHFNASNPEVLRLDGSCRTLVVHDYIAQVCLFPSELICRYIHDFNAGRIKGSTGREGWYTLTKAERRASLGPNKVQHLTTEN